MTHHKAPEPVVPIRYQGRPLDEVIAERRPHLVGLVLERLQHEMAIYASLPNEQLLGDIAEAVDRCITVFLASLADERALTERELAELGRSAARRAEEGIALDAVISGYVLALDVVVADLTTAAPPDRVGDALASLHLVLDFLHRALPVVTAHYLDERDHLMDARQEADQALLARLLDGLTTSEAHELPTALPDRYVVLRLAIGLDASEQADGVDHLVAARRKLRRIRTELRRAVPDGLLDALTPAGGIALIPGPVPEIGSVVDRLRAVAEAEVRATSVETTPDEVPAAVHLAGELLDVVRLTGRASGHFGLDDLLVEYQLSRPGPVRRRLAECLAPFGARPDLLATLRTYLATGGNRRRTALDLHLHPNTVDYRVRKIAAMTGLDPGQADDAVHLQAALVAFDAEMVATGGTGSGPGTSGR